MSSLRSTTAKLAVTLLLLLPCAGRAQTSATAQLATESRASQIARSKVWLPTDVGSMDLLAGPVGPNNLEQGATIDCVYRVHKYRGKSPKFGCQLPSGRLLKVKYGRNNGEVYGEVVASRLLWALGFGADSMYSVRIVCHGCPPSIGAPLQTGDRMVDPAAVEQKMHGTLLSDHWSWKELDAAKVNREGATRAELDAFRLLAALIQHGDSKPQQQRLICVHVQHDDAACTPLLMIQDLGNTFGHAAMFSGVQRLSVNFERWQAQPVWKAPDRCVANLDGVFTSTLHDPVISEEGRQFLANLLMQLSDEQLHDMFAAGRVTLRPRKPEDPHSDAPSIDDWVDAFKQKRIAIVQHHCPD